MRPATRIAELAIIPIAFDDPPLLNVWGVHEPLALRTVVRLTLADGTIGYGEGSGERVVLDALAAARDLVLDRDVFDLNGLERDLTRLLAPAGDPAALLLARTVFALCEVAALDAQGRHLGVPVHALLGGAVREAVPYCAYLFAKWPGHPAADRTPEQAAADPWGPALDPVGIVAQARGMRERFGFTSFKLKGGVFAPDEEATMVEALATEFPGLPVRLDPNAGWTIETSLRMADRLRDTLQYLEDPTPGIPGMSAVAAGGGLPLATNMCITQPEHLAAGFSQRAVSVLLLDHHTWGGLRHTVELAATCRAFGIEVAMHSNSHLGISLRAMTQVAAVLPELPNACDTHYPWNRAEDVLVGGPIPIVDGAVAVDDRPGLGIEIDEELLAERHRRYLDSGRTVRDDTGYLRRFVPDFDPGVPRW